MSKSLSSALASRRNERALQRTVDCLVVGDLVVDVGLVERGAAELGKFRSFLGRLLGERFAGVVIFRRDVEFFHQSQCLLVHRLVIALHISREGHHVLVLAFLQRQLRGRDVELTRRISDVRNLRIGGSGALRRSDAGCEQQSCKRAGKPDEYHDESPSSGHNGRASAPPLDAAAEQRFPGFFPQRCRALIPLQSCGNRVFERRPLRIKSTLLRLHLAHCADCLGCCPRRENPMRRRISQRLASDCAAAGATVRELSVGRRRSPRASQALVPSFNSARIAGSQRTDPRATSRTAIILQPT